MRSDDDMVAYALETEPALLPYMPELLADFDELGSDAELIAHVLHTFDLPENTHVIDLGCGKGAVAVEIAAELGFSVLGIDLFQPFIDSARALARQEQVEALCAFRHGNVATLAGKLPPADAVVFAALGDTLGSLQDTIGIIRQYVREGGLIVVSDAFVRPGGSTDFPGFEHYAEHDETVRRLTAHGDPLVTEVHEDGDEDEPDDAAAEDESALILARAEALAQQHPDDAAALRAFAASQASENRYIEENLVGVIWVLQRGA